MIKLLLDGLFTSWWFFCPITSSTMVIVTSRPARPNISFRGKEAVKLGRRPSSNGLSKTLPKPINIIDSSLIEVRHFWNYDSYYLPMKSAIFIVFWKLNLLISVHFIFQALMRRSTVPSDGLITLPEDLRLLPWLTICPLWRGLNAGSFTKAYCCGLSYFAFIAMVSHKSHIS